MSDEKEVIRDRLLALLKRVPAKVNAGGILTVREFKVFHAKTTKMLAKKLTLGELTSILSQAETWYA